MVFLALPIAYFAAFKYNLGLKGLWLGYGTSTLCLSILYSVIIFKINWKKTAEEAASASSES